MNAHEVFKQGVEEFRGKYKTVFQWIFLNTKDEIVAGMDMNNIQNEIESDTKSQTLAQLQEVVDRCEREKITCEAHIRTSSHVCLCEALKDASSSCYNYNSALSDIQSHYQEQIKKIKEV